MKLLKASFLLAAAATASLSEAAIFNLQWSGAAYGNTAVATGTIDLDIGAMPNPVNQGGVGLPAWVNSINVTVSGAASGNGSFTTTDFERIIFRSSGFTLNLNAELVGQNGGLFTGVNGDFNIFNDNAVAPTAPNGSSPNVLKTNGGMGDPMNLISFVLGGVPDIMAWMSSVNNAQRTYKAGYNLAVVALEGAHHRPLMSYDDMGKERATWVTGDFANSSRRRDVNVASGEVGTSWKAESNGVFGVAAGYGSQREDLPIDGRNDVTGNYIFAEYDHRLSSGWIVSVLGMVGSWDAEILRGYLDAGLPDHSYGETGVTTRTARLRFDAPTLATVGGFGFSPFVSYSVTQTEVDAYTETGGAFPASYDAQKHQSEEGRLGLVAARDLTTTTRLRLTFEAVHRFDGQGPALSGQDITGGVAFELDGSDPSPDCVRYGFDIDHKLTPTTMLSFSAFGSSTGEVPDVSGALSLRHAF